MKRIVLTILAIGMTTLAFSQKTFILSRQEKKGFLSLSAGGSMPVGRFASCSPIDEKAGLAGDGMAVSVSAGYRFVGPIGLMIRGEQHRNAVQTHALIDALYRSESDVWTAQADQWSITTVMGGPYISLPFGRVSLDARLLAGRATAVLPGTSMAGNFGNVDVAVKTTGSQSTATALGGGLSLRYRLGRSLSLHLNTDYTRSQLKFDNLTSTAWSSNGRSESSLYSSGRVIDVVSLSGGVAILFGNSHRPF